MLTGTLGLGYSSNNTAQDITFLAADAEREGVLGTADQELRDTAGGAQERWLGLLSQFHQAVVEHGTDETADIVVAKVFLAVLLAVGGCLAFLIDIAQGDGLLLVFLDVNNHAVVVAHGVVYAFCGFLGHGY